jgi:hypothetical protein
MNTVSKFTELVSRGGGGERERERETERERGRERLRGGLFGV